MYSLGLFQLDLAIFQPLGDIPCLHDRGFYSTRLRDAVVIDSADMALVQVRSTIEIWLNLSLWILLHNTVVVFMILKTIGALVRSIRLVVN